MTERIFRIILGTILMVLLYIQMDTLFYIFIAILMFEGITNWRIPILISRIRFDKNHADRNSHIRGEFKYKFEAERAMRLSFSFVLIGSLFLLPNQLWFLNWVIASFLTLSGIVNFCPLVTGFRWLGLR